MIVFDHILGKPKVEGSKPSGSIVMGKWSSMDLSENIRYCAFCKKRWEEKNMMRWVIIIKLCQCIPKPSDRRVPSPIGDGDYAHPSYGWNARKSRLSRLCKTSFIRGYGRGRRNPAPLGAGSSRSRYARTSYKTNALNQLSYGGLV